LDASVGSKHTLQCVRLPAGGRKLDRKRWLGSARPSWLHQLRRGFYWEGIQPSSAAIYGFPTDYNFILAQTFTVDQTGYYDFLFPASGDNYFSFYINGTVFQDVMKPTISGGTQIGTTQNNFASIYTVSSGAWLNQGTNTAYALINEKGFSSGVLIGQSSFTFAGVPEPSTYALFGLGALVLLVGCRRRTV